MTTINEIKKSESYFIIKMQFKQKLHEKKIYIQYDRVSTHLNQIFKLQEIIYSPGTVIVLGMFNKMYILQIQMAGNI